MSFRTDYPIVAKLLKPDIAVILECEDEEHLKNKVPFHNFVWKGGNPSKGIGVFSFSEDYNLALHQSYDATIRDVIPISVTGKDDFTLFACWAKRDLEYVSGLTRSLNSYSDIISGKAIIVGDVNANKSYIDGGDDYDEFIEFLQDRDIHSCYHAFFREEHGSETRPTHFFWRDPKRTFHIDYCLASSYFIDKLESVAVPEYGVWQEYSDHVPLIVEYTTL